MEEEIIKKASEVALKAARRGGEVLKENFGRDYWIKEKGKGDTVTEIDLKTEKVILDLIRKEFPDHGVLAEESGKSKISSDYLWTVDPLDGTTNYSLGSPFFCTSISLAYKNQTAVGVTLVPMTGEIFHAVKGGGAYRNFQGKDRPL